MNRSALIRATLVGTVLQLAMILAGHFEPDISQTTIVKDSVFMWGGMALSTVAGLIYAWSARSALGDSMIGGAISGAVCALIGIAVSVVLGDTPPFVLAAGPLMSAVTGLVGGGIGKVVSTPKTT